MGKIGFGTYRLSIRSAEHKKALTLALSNGCSLIDTAANYTNGDSERLIGEVLRENPSFKPIIMTKAGYIQGESLKLLQELHAAGKAREDLVEIDEQLKHSIHPDFLQAQFEGSLSRLGLEKVDYFLLHNPEYYFKSPGANQDEYYERIQKAFIYLESEVEKGRIKGYGISSNNFILPLNDAEVTNISRVVECAIQIKALNFKIVQFPFNLLEINALEKLGEFGDESLLELCQRHELITVVNRPLNAFSQGQLVRLATYDDKKLDEARAEACFKECMDKLRERWNAQVDSEQDGVTDKNDFDQIDMIKQFTDIWNKLPTPDAVEQVFYGHFFPFLARAWGNGGLSPEESQPYYQLFEYAELYSRKHLSSKARDFKNQAQQVGLLPIQDDVPFSVMAIETYLDYGFDYVLVGMKKTEYVDQLKHLF